MTLNTNEFIKRANIVHNNKYEYSLSEYTTIRAPVKIICHTHGEFLQVPADHLRNSGCPKCGRMIQSNKSSKTQTEFIALANEIHNNQYNYSLVEYKNCMTKIKIVCKNHGEFLQSPTQHLNSLGCQQCALISGANKKVKTTEEFIKAAKAVHDDKYNYSLVKYERCDRKVKIICPIHNIILQTPEKHISGAGCQKCSSNISKQEIKWLDSLNIPEDYRQHKIVIKNSVIKSDAYDPNTNTIYEFWGDYWHGNPVRFNSADINKRNKFTFGELYNMTLNKRQLILENGYKLVEIWESDWIRLQETTNG